MLEYQKRYLENTTKIASLSDIFGVVPDDFDTWYKTVRTSRETIEKLRAENMELLNTHLFPALDDIFNSTEEERKHLEEFGDELMDWSINLDIGIYVLIHETLLNTYRYLKDRNNTIKELYKLGMGLYYLNSMVRGIEGRQVDALYFEDELLFTEAASYLKYFAQISDEETKGYVIRGLANISIASKDHKKKVKASSDAIKVIRDDYYRQLAPGLPWDTYLRRAYQQMSANRYTLDRGDLSTEQLMEIMEACQIIFEPEQGVKDPNVRWLWPYYEMEYSCGLADLNLTMSRMEALISEAAPDRYDDSGTYANVQLPIYYGRMIKNNEQLRDRHHLTFLDQAYRKMMNYILTYPQEQINGAFYYTLTLIVSDYYECDQVMPYKEVSAKLMRRFIGFDYIKSQKISSLLKCCSGYIFECDENFFDDIPFISTIKDKEEKRKALSDYSEDCGLYFDYGLLKMHIERTRFTRDFFEREFEIYKLHTLSAYIDLKERESTKVFADVCLGHHSWYNGHDGYPEEYVRNSSPYRQMTDLLSIVIWLNENYHGNMKECVNDLSKYEGNRFSPLLCDYFRDEKLQEELTAILDKDEATYYKELFKQIKEPEKTQR